MAPPGPKAWIFKAHISSISFHDHESLHRQSKAIQVEVYIAILLRAYFLDIVSLTSWWSCFMVCIIMMMPGQVLSPTQPRAALCRLEDSAVVVPVSLQDASWSQWNRVLVSLPLKWSQLFSVPELSQFEGEECVSITMGDRPLLTETYISNLR